jgi:hypothetical protein
LRKNFGIREISGVWRKFHNEGIYKFYSCPSDDSVVTSKILYGARLGEKMYKIFMCKPVGKQPHERLRLK